MAAVRSPRLSGGVNASATGTRRAGALPPGLPGSGMLAERTTRTAIMARATEGMSEKGARYVCTGSILTVELV
jgi:hypothetical protein